MLHGLETRSGAAAGVSQPGALLRRALDLGPRLGRSGTGRGLGSWGSPSSDGYHADVCKVLARASRAHNPMAIASRAHVSPGVGRVDADLGVDRGLSVMTMKPPIQGFPSTPLHSPLHSIMRNPDRFPRIYCTDVYKQPISCLNSGTHRLSVHVGRKPGPFSDWRKPCRTQSRPGITRSRRTW